MAGGGGKKSRSKAKTKAKPAGRSRREPPRRKRIQVVDAIKSGVGYRLAVRVRDAFAARGMTDTAGTITFLLDCAKPGLTIGDALELAPYVRTAGRLGCVILAELGSPGWKRELKRLSDRVDREAAADADGRQR